MNCTTCIKLNAIPECIDSDAFELTGLTFPDHLGDVIVATFTNTATNRRDYLPLVINGSGQVTGGFDVAAIYPLMSHWYKLEFIKDGVPVSFTLTNPDTTTEEGCCLEFTTMEGYTGTDEWVLSSTVCAV